MNTFPKGFFIFFIICFTQLAKKKKFNNNKYFFFILIQAILFKANLIYFLGYLYSSCHKKRPIGRFFKNYLENLQFVASSFHQVLILKCLLLYSFTVTSIYTILYKLLFHIEISLMVNPTLKSNISIICLIDCIEIVILFDEAKDVLCIFLLIIVLVINYKCKYYM